MTYNTNDLYKSLVCEDNEDSSPHEANETDTLPLIMCIDTSGWNPALTVTDASEITNR